MLVGAVSALYLLHQGLNLVDLGFLKTFQAVVILLAEIPLAWLADRYSRRLSVVLSVFFASTWLIVTAMGSRPVHFFIAEFFNALSLALSSGAFISYLVDIGKKASPETHARQLIGKYRKYELACIGVGAFAGSAFIDVDSPVIWFVAGISCLVLLATFSWKLPPDVQHTTGSHSRFLADVRQLLHTLFSGRAVSPGVLCSLMSIMLFYQVLIQYWQPLAYSYLPNDWQGSGIHYGFLFLAILLAQAAAGRFCEKNPASKAVGWSLAVNLVSIALGWAAQYQALLILPSLVAGFGGIRLLNTALHAEFHEALPAAHRSTLDSMLSTGLRILLLLVLPLFAWCVEAMGWAAMLVLYTVPVVFALLVRRQGQLATEVESDQEVPSLTPGSVSPHQKNI